MPSPADTLQGCDTALLPLEDRQGNALDTLYRGPVHDSAFAGLRTGTSSTVKSGYEPQ